MRRGADDRAVSPVIGMIMILAISVTGIAAVVAWGLPAVDEMKATVETRAVANQFKELDQDVKQLVAGTADKTAKRWHPTLSRGAITIVDATDRWLVGYATCNGGVTTGCNDKDLGGVLQEYSWSLQAISDTDNELVLYNAGPNAINFRMTGVTVDNGAETGLQVNDVDVAGNMDADGYLLAAGATRRLYVFTSSGADQPIDTSGALSGRAFRFTVTDTIGTASTADDLEAAMFWVYDAGSAEFKLETTGSPRAVDLTNGAVIVGNGGAEVIDNVPGIPPVKQTPDGWKYFVRGISFQGGASFAGEDRFDVLLALYGTTTLARESGVGQVYTYVGGDHRDAWGDYFNSGNGYAFEPDGNADPLMKAWKQRVEVAGVYQPIGMTFVHSVVTVT